MCDGYIAILDSGVGGLNVLKNVYKSFPDESFLYFGDNENAPYGNKSLDELFQITKKNIDVIKNYGIKLLVLGCNTLSTCLFNEICNYAKIPVVGVFPPIDYVLERYEKILLLSTVRTSENYANKSKRLKVIGLPRLANDIEKNILNLDRVNFANHFNASNLENKKNFDVVILGCTHYAFVKNQIFDHLKPQIILSSEEFVMNDIEKILQKPKSIEKYNGFSGLFLGKNAEFYKNYCVNRGFEW